MPRSVHSPGASGQAVKPPPAFPGMRIGLLGGSFNPAHEAHRHISVAALNRLGLHQVWWIVTPGNPLKSASELAPLDERLAYAARVAAHPKIVVTAFEAALGTAYSAHTIRYLQRRYPGVQFIWIMGGDNLAQFHRWRDWAQIFSSIPIFVADRPECRHAAFASPAARRFASAYLPENRAGLLTSSPAPAWTYLSLPLRNISSTAIRAARS